jgi:hypothetical protein
VQLIMDFCNGKIKQTKKAKLKHFSGQVQVWKFTE